MISFSFCSFNNLNVNIHFYNFLKANNNPEVGGAMNDPLVQKAVRYALDYEGMRLLGGGQTVTLALGVADVGDSIYDSAVVIDRIAFE